MEFELKFKHEGSAYWVETKDRKFHINNRRSVVSKVRKFMQSAESEQDDCDEEILRIVFDEESAKALIDMDLPQPEFANLTDHVLASFDGTTIADVRNRKNA